MELLIDILELPYDEIHENVDEWKLLHPQIWASTKGNDYSYLGLDICHEIFSGKAKYLHWHGNHKTDELLCQQIATTLHALFPQYYYKIIALFPALANEYSGVHYQSECEKMFLSNRFIQECNSDPPKKLKWAPKNLNHIMFKDFYKFEESVNAFLEKANFFSKSYLNGRDSLSLGWYDSIIEKEQPFVASPVIRVIQSSYDWANLYREYKTPSQIYDNYDNKISEKGKYYTLIVSQLNPDGFSLFPINELEASILSFCESPINKKALINRLIEEPHTTFEGKSSDNFKTLIWECLTRLILMKALQPIG